MRHKRTSAVLTACVGFLVPNLGLALGQWAPDRVTFPAQAGVEVPLQRGDERIIYMTAEESEALNFDFYPSDFECLARGPDGQVPVRLTDHRRLLDGWRSYWSIGSVEAGSGGSYRIACTGHGDAPLVVATPARFTVAWASPTFALAVLVAVVLGLAMVHSVLAIARQFRGVRTGTPV